MPELSWNAEYWGGGYDWKTGGGGEEWSIPWGGSEPQWFGTLYPRLHRFLPSRAILEIAPGFGRWTKFLLPACEEYFGIDLSHECVQACESAFAKSQHARFIQNDGLSLSIAPDAHFDFVFSFDSLVHAEMEVLDSYVPQILGKLTPGGVAFVHHSNLAALATDVENNHARARSVSAEKVAGLVAESGGKILVQERVSWFAPHLNDCFTLFARKEHPDTAPPARIENARLSEEASIVRDAQAPYIRVR